MKYEISGEWNRMTEMKEKSLRREGKMFSYTDEPPPDSNNGN